MAQALEKEVPQASVSLRRTIAARRDDVFRAWTDPEHLRKWWGPPGYETPEATVDLRPGGRYRFTMKKAPDGAPFFLTGTYREIAPPEKLVYTWTWEGRPNDTGENSLVTVRFLERGDSTEVVIVHDLLTTEEMRAGHTKGWIGCLDRLETHVSA
jgi:uncharacterized protein YndB with AHSA1/START domain